MEGILSAPERDIDALRHIADEAIKARDKAKRASYKSANDVGLKDALTCAVEAQEFAASEWGAEKIRAAIAASADAVRLWLTLATLDPYAPISPPFDLAACVAGRLDVANLAAVYRRNGFTVLADDVESAA